MQHSATFPNIKTPQESRMTEVSERGIARPVATTVLDEAPTGQHWINTHVLYAQVKKALSSIPTSKFVFEQSIFAIATVTNLINDKTKANILVVDLEKANDLIDKLDGILSDQFIRLDDGLDALRAKFMTTVRKLMESLVAHKEVAVEYINTKTAQANQVKNDAVDKMKSRFERFLATLQEMLEVVHKRFPVEYEKASALAVSSYQTVEQRTGALLNTAKVSSTGLLGYGFGLFKPLETKVRFLLKTARPYVHTAVQQGTPYFTKAVDVGMPYVQPYVEKAKPYVDPLVGAAQVSTLMGPYVAKVVETATFAFEEAKTYCTGEEEAMAEASEASEVPPSTTGSARATVSAPVSAPAPAPKVYHAAAATTASSGTFRRDSDSD